jgi:hypothetical protein
MRSDAVVTISIGFQNSAQMGLAQDNEVVYGIHAGSIRDRGCDSAEPHPREMPPLSDVQAIRRWDLL